LEGVRQTADSLSQERREGTLGILFLSNLRGYDVVAGKLVAAALSVGYGLLAFAPALAIPILAGGVTGGEVTRTALALATGLAITMAIGLWISARSKDDQKALLTAVGVLVGVAAVPVLSDFILQRGAYNPGNAALSLLSPIYAFQMAMDAGYRTGPNLFWLSLLTLNVLAGFCIWRAGRVAELSWRAVDRPGRSGSSRSSGSAGAAAAWKRRLLLDRNPGLWLAARQPGQRALVWTAVLLASFNHLPIYVMLLLGAGVAGGGPSLWMLASLPSLLLFLASRLLIAVAATRVLAGARRSGVIEVLLTTPLSDGEFVRGQWRQLRTLLTVPTCVYVLLQVTLLGLWWLAHEGGSGSVIMAGASVVPTVFSVAVTVTDFVALCWVGMWLGASTRNPARAAPLTVLYVILIPWLVIRFLPIGFLLISFFGLSPLFHVFLYSLLGLLKNFVFILWARGRLRGGFREIISGAYSRSVRGSLVETGRTFGRLVRQARSWQAD
jgi:ABC-type transport system involved in multi-copper enzyme maturation permease subunit